MTIDERRTTNDEPADEAPREAALIAALADVIERVCVVEQKATVVQSPAPKKPAKAA
jgi:hypothetical protein